jgi:putative transposase
LRLLTQHIDELRTAFRETRRHHPFAIDAMVVLPDHLHTIWTLPEGDADFATRWRMIKSAFSRSVATGERISDSRAAKGERGICREIRDIERRSGCGRSPAVSY